MGKIAETEKENSAVEGAPQIGAERGRTVFFRQKADKRKRAETAGEGGKAGKKAV